MNHAWLTVHPSAVTEIGVFFVDQHSWTPGLHAHMDYHGVLLERAFSPAVKNTRRGRERVLFR